MLSIDKAVNARSGTPCGIFPFRERHSNRCCRLSKTASANGFDLKENRRRWIIILDRNPRHSASSAPAPAVTAAMKRNVRFGQPAKLTPEHVALGQQFIDEGPSARELAKMFKVHPATLYRAISSSPTA